MLSFFAMMGTYKNFEERGFVSQVTAEDELGKLLSQGKVACYIGFDPTAPSLHAGSLVPLMALGHMQRAGHWPIAVLGDGTAMVGDPSGRTDMRKMLSQEQIQANLQKIAAQVSPFIGEQGLVVRNAEWLLDLNYVSFLREIGRHFSVNRMLSYESYKIRLEKGLSFLEFNYQLLQAYDFLTLFRRHACVLQMGGDDQWGNIVAGIDLIRRLEGKQAYGLTFPLLEGASGQKMGKSVQGAVWLDASMTTPYEFYQYFRNTHDLDVGRYLALLTYLPMEEVRKLGELKDSELNRAKDILAYEVTKIVHGADQADKARKAARTVFAGVEGGVEGIPTTQISYSRLQQGVLVVDLFAEIGLCKSKSEARRLVEQGGARLGEHRVNSIGALVTEAELPDGSVLLRAGKKKVHRLLVSKGE